MKDHHRHRLASLARHVAGILLMTAAASAVGQNDSATPASNDSYRDAAQQLQKAMTEAEESARSAMDKAEQATDEAVKEIEAGLGVGSAEECQVAEAQGVDDPDCDDDNNAPQAPPPPGPQPPRQ